MSHDDDQIRSYVRSQLKRWLVKLECDEDVVKQNEYKRKFISKLKSSPIAMAVDTANQQHYEVPTEFFKTVLGPRLKYSSCVFPSENSTLAQAEEIALEQVCQRAQVTNSDIEIMDLGCGWGSLGLYLLEKFSRVKVTCLSNSATQKKHIEAEAKKRGFANRLFCITADIGTYDSNKTYDRIISIEMFEHTKNLEQLLSKVSKWLKPDGKLFIHILSHSRFGYNFDERKGSDTEWMAANFFTGGTMFSSDTMLYFQNDLVIKDLWLVNGEHYGKTLNAWLALMDQNIHHVEEIFASAYGAQNVEKHVKNWRMFFMFCAESFNYNNGNDWLITQLLFSPKRLLAKI